MVRLIKTTFGGTGDAVGLSVASAVAVLLGDGVVAVGPAVSVALLVAEGMAVESAVGVIEGGLAVAVTEG